MMMDQITVRSPIVSWFVAFQKMSNDGLKLVHPVACTALAAASTSIIGLSRQFGKLGPAPHAGLMFLFVMYTALTAVMTMGKWISGLAFHASIPLHPVAKVLLKSIVSGVLMYWCHVAFVLRDQYLAASLGILAVQVIYLTYIFGYKVNVGVIPVFVGLAGAVLCFEIEGVIRYYIVSGGMILAALT